LMSRADQAMYLAKRSRTVATGPPETGDPPEERSGERPGERPEVPVERTGERPGERPEVPVERPGERPEPPVDMRSLKDGVDQIRRSLESLLRDLAGEPD
ncbi:MAG TPA: hypothetical protein VFH58_15850, partial [Acidimicrobiales bacterium]|nr:hypothetical protein [Acidimicrobiales bacterium]